MSIFETHFHYNQEWDASEYVNESLNAGVKYLLAVASDLDSTIISQKLAESTENIFFTSGLHPHEAVEFNNNLMAFRDAAFNSKCIAIGEIGLDFFYEYSDKNKQIEVFEQFLNLALELDLPAVIHCRDKDGSDLVYEKSYDLLKSFTSQGGHFVIHCYTGSIEYAEKFLAIGGFFGVTGIVTFPKAQNVRDIVKILPIDRILLETDTPYLAPKPFRGKTNHSKYLPYIAEAVAVEKSLTVESVCEQTYKNAISLFTKCESLIVAEL